MQPTAESGGKGKVIKLLKEKFHFKKILMIGDGATDMEACPPAVCIKHNNFFPVYFCFKQLIWNSIRFMRVKQSKI